MLISRLLYPKAAHLPRTCLVSAILYRPAPADHWLAYDRPTGAHAAHPRPTDPKQHRSADVASVPAACWPVLSGAFLKCGNKTELPLKPAYVISLAFIYAADLSNAALGDRLTILAR
jgi:hypothetical protein